MTGKRYAIWNIGCQMNEADARAVAARLEAMGYHPAPEGEADLALVTSCVVRQQAEDKVLSRLRHLEAEKKRRPELRVALMGCLVGMDSADRLKEHFPFVDVFVPPSDLNPLIAWLEQTSVPAGDANSEFCFSETGCRDADGLPPSRAGDIRAHVPAVLGCSRACSYCIIPSRRGRERSRRPEDVLRESRALIEQGVLEIVLLGQIIDRYGADLDPPTDLARLLRDLAGLDGVKRIRFLTNHPTYLDDSLLQAVAECPAVCPHFELPIQAGHDDILARMRRGYTVDDYRRLAGRIRDRIPAAALHTDLIVGFPGETPEHVDATLNLARELRFDKIHLARYSPRPGTVAARRYPDDVPDEEKEARRLRLDRLQADIQAEKNRRFLNRPVEVLVERPEPRKPGRWRGRTVCDRLVFVDGPGDLKGRLLKVNIAWTGPFTLVGAPASPLLGKHAELGVQETV